jgi:hypothetical protein
VTSIQEHWRDLEAALPAGDEGWLSQRIRPTAMVAIYAAVAGGTGLPGLLIETPASTIPALVEYPSARGFAVRAVGLQLGRGGTVRLELGLTQPAYRDIFATLAEDVVGAIAAASTQSGAVQNFVARLRIWQEFMRHRSPDGLNQEEQVGLLSELHVLETVLLATISPFDAVSAWRGPHRGMHDFVLPACHIEVKSTTFLPPTSFHASRLTQLDETLANPLVLAHCAWNTAALVGTALPDLIERLRIQLASSDAAALSRFNDSLLRAGYLDLHAAAYRQPLYELVAIRLFSVRAGFPRLRLTDMPPGIVECSYEVDLLACNPFSITHTELISLAKKVVPG